MAVTLALTSAAASLVLESAAPAQAQPPVLTAWLAANSDCKAGGPKAAQACEKRDQISARLKRRGCVYQQDGDWWRCPHH